MICFPLRNEDKQRAGKETEELYRQLEENQVRQKKLSEELRRQTSENLQQKSQVQKKTYFYLKNYFS